MSRLEPILPPDMGPVARAACFSGFSITTEAEAGLRKKPHYSNDHFGMPVTAVK